MAGKFYDTVTTPYQRVRSSHITYMEIKAYPDFSKKSTSSDAIPLLFKVTAGARNHTFVLATGFRTEEDAKNWIKQNWK